MTQQTIKNHVYEVVPANAIGASYVRHQGAGTWGPAGTIEFTNGAVSVNTNAVDRLLCNDFIVAFDFYANLGEMYRLYKAAFNRLPDQAGLSNNLALMDGGPLTITQMAAAFLASAEGQSVYPPTSTDAAFVTLLYLHVLARFPAQPEVQAWLDLMSGSGYTRAMVLVGFSDSAENHANVDGSLLGGVQLIRSYFGV